LQKRKVLSLEWKSEGVMDDKSESMELTEEASIIGLCESELERLVRGSRKLILQTRGSILKRTVCYS